MTSNILRFDPSGTNMLNDADYNSSTQRTNGVVPGIAQSALHNKLFHQTSSVAAAAAEALSNLGATISDANYSAMVTAFQNGFASAKALSGVEAKSADYLLLAADKGKAFTATSALTFTFTAAATLGSGWYCYIKNGSSGAVVLDPDSTETIDGATTLTLNPDDGFFIYCTGTAFLTIGRNASATQAQQESATVTNAYVSPGRQQYHPSAAKAWVNFNGTGIVAIRASYNITSVADLLTGLYQPAFTTAMSSSDYAIAASGNGVAVNSGDGAYQGPSIYSLATTSFALSCGSNTATRGDWPLVCAVVFGDQ